MKYAKKKEKQLLPWIVAVMLVLVLVLCAMLLIQAKRPKAPKAAAPVATVSKAEKPASEAVQETVEEEYPPLMIETPYCHLQYPGQWAEDLRTEITGQMPEAVVSFYGAVAQEEQLLFKLYFCGAEGFPVGIFETEDGLMMDVTLEIAELDLKDSWPQEEIDRICAMQEAMNYVLDGMKRLPSFTAVE